MKVKYLDLHREDYKELSSSQLKRMADYWQRQYLLKKAKRNGYNQIYCPIKEKFYNENKMHVAHFIDRHHLQHRYSEYNCHLISSSSNMWDAKEPMEGYKSKHHYEYEMWLRGEIGDKKVEELLQVTKSFTIFAKEDYISIIKKFRNG